MYGKDNLSVIIPEAQFDRAEPLILPVFEADNQVVHYTHGVSRAAFAANLTMAYYRCLLRQANDQNQYDAALAELDAILKAGEANLKSAGKVYKIIKLDAEVSPETRYELEDEQGARHEFHGVYAFAMLPNGEVVAVEAKNGAHILACGYASHLLWAGDVAAIHGQVKKLEHDQETHKDTRLGQSAHEVNELLESKGGFNDKSGLLNPPKDVARNSIFTFFHESNFYSEFDSTFNPIERKQREAEFEEFKKSAKTYEKALERYNKKFHEFREKYNLPEFKALPVLANKTIYLSQEEVFSIFSKLHYVWRKDACELIAHDGELQQIILKSLPVRHIVVSPMSPVSSQNWEEHVAKQVRDMHAEPLTPTSFYQAIASAMPDVRVAGERNEHLATSEVLVRVHQGSPLTPTSVRGSWKAPFHSIPNTTPTQTTPTTSFFRFDDAFRSLERLHAQHTSGAAYQTRCADVAAVLKSRAMDKRFIDKIFDYAYMIGFRPEAGELAQAKAGFIRAYELDIQAREDAELQLINEIFAASNMAAPLSEEAQCMLDDRHNQLEEMAYNPAYERILGREVYKAMKCQSFDFRQALEAAAKYAHDQALSRKSEHGPRASYYTV